MINAAMSLLPPFSVWLAFHLLWLSPHSNTAMSGNCTGDKCKVLVLVVIGLIKQKQKLKAAVVQQLFCCFTSDDPSNYNFPWFKGSPTRVDDDGLLRNWWSSLISSFLNVNKTTLTDMVTITITITRRRRRRRATTFFKHFDRQQRKFSSGCCCCCWPVLECSVRMSGQRVFYW